MMKLIGISLIIICLLALANWHLLKIRKTETQVELLNWATSEKHTKRTLLLGDSFTAYGIKNSNQCSLINLAYPGDHFGDYFFKFKKYLETNSIEYVVLQMNPHKFKSIKNDVSKKYNLFIPEKEESFPILNEDQRFEYGQILLKKLSYRIKGSAANKTIYLDTDKTLRRRNQYQWTKTKNKDLELKTTINTFFSSPLDWSNTRFIDSIHGLAAEKKIKVIWAYFPNTIDYSKRLLEIHPNIYNQIDSIKRTYEVHGLINIEDVFFSKPENFMDPIHVNDKGCSELTTLFCQKIESVY